MNNDSNNIKNYSAEDIRRYWRNEMSTQEMHALEKAAMSDPFLADALEGYSKLQKDPSDDFALLKKRIAERAIPAPVVPIKRKNNWMRVAAILILLAGVGIVTFTMFLKNKNEIAKVQYNKADASPAAKENASRDESTAQSGPNTLSDTARAIPPTDVASAVPKREKNFLKPKGDTQVHSNFSTDARDSLLTGNEVAENNNADYKKAAAPVAMQKSESFRKQSNVDRSDSTARPSVASAEGRSKDVDQAFYFNTFSGKVVDVQNRSIPFANVRMNNANQIASTDQYGMFQFKSKDTIADITIASPGFEEKNLTLNSNQSGLITMEPHDTKKKLSEVVVGAGTKRKSSPGSDLHVYVMDAQPVIGWDKYNLYLDSNKRLPPNEPTRKGEVVVSFKVSQKGQLSSFDVEQSLGNAYDQEAIRLIKEGPGWRVTKGKKTRVKVIVRF